MPRSQEIMNECCPFMNEYGEYWKGIIYENVLYRIWLYCFINTITVERKDSRQKFNISNSLIIHKENTWKEIYV